MYFSTLILKNPLSLSIQLILARVAPEVCEITVLNKEWILFTFYRNGRTNKESALIEACVIADCLQQCQTSF